MAMSGTRPIDTEPSDLTSIPAPRCVVVRVVIVGKSEVVGGDGVVGAGGVQSLPSRAEPAGQLEHLSTRSSHAAQNRAEQHCLPWFCAAFELAGMHTPSNLPHQAAFDEPIQIYCCSIRSNLQRFRRV